VPQAGAGLGKGTINRRWVGSEDKKTARLKKNFLVKEDRGRRAVQYFVGPLAEGGKGTTLNTSRQKGEKKLFRKP